VDSENSATRLTTATSPTRLFLVTAKGGPFLTVSLENEAGAMLSMDITLRMDVSKLRGPIEQERWVLLDLVAERIQLLAENHRRQGIRGSMPKSG
jgi:hypothetical protein